jgi:hypothetical protein
MRCSPLGLVPPLAPAAALAHLESGVGAGIRQKGVATAELVPPSNLPKAWSGEGP